MSSNIDLTIIKDLSQVGSNVLLIIALVVIWRAYQALQKSYEVLLVKSTEALVRVADHLGYHNDKE